MMSEVEIRIARRTNGIFNLRNQWFCNLSNAGLLFLYNTLSQVLAIKTPPPPRYRCCQTRLAIDISMFPIVARLEST